MPKFNAGDLVKVWFKDNEAARDALAPFNGWRGVVYKSYLSKAPVKVIRCSEHSALCQFIGGDFYVILDWIRPITKFKGNV